MLKTFIKVRKIWIFVFIIIVSFFTTYIFLSFYNKDTRSINFKDTIKADQELQRNENIKFGSWIPYWGHNEGFASLKTHKSDFDSISPVWYELKKDGTLKDLKPSDFQAFLTFAHNNEIDVIPSIALFDHEVLSDVLENETNYESQINSIIDEVDTFDFQGIDLDYESIELDDKDRYFDFIKILSDKLHERKKILVISVIPKWGDDINYPSLPETREVQDWQKLSKYADEIRIMAYDYTFAKATFPGPIAPLSWLEQLLAYSVENIPKEKIVLGIHLYSYEWWKEVENENVAFNSIDSLTFFPNGLDNPISDSKSARSYTYSIVKNLVQNNDGELSNFDGEKIFKYTKTNSETNKIEKRVLIYIDQKGVDQRIELAKKYGISGVSFWRLGDEGELLDNLKIE